MLRSLCRGVPGEECLQHTPQPAELRSLAESDPRLRPFLTQKLGTLLTSESLILLTPHNLQKWHSPKISQMLNV